MCAIGDRIKFLREKYDLNKTEMGKRIGVDRSAITRYETGEMRPNLDVMLRIKDAFNVSLDWIVGFTTDEDLKYNGIIKECKKANISPEKLQQIIEILKQDDTASMK